MTVRTSQRQVEGIINLSKASPNAMPFIEVANNLVNNVCVPEGYDDETLKNIECYLACHFYRLRYPDAIEQKIGESTDTYARGSASGKGLNGTAYGQMAMVIDFKGALATMQAANDKGTHRRKVGIVHVGPSCHRLPTAHTFNPFL